MEINDIKKEYTKKINGRFKKNKNIILDSFIEFYGEEYRSIITDRLNDISFLYYINDFTIFYLVDNLKNENNDKFKNIFFSIPYIVYLIKNGLYKKDITQNNFYELGINKIVGSSDDELLNDKELLKYSIAIALREDNESPYEVNIPIDGDIKRIIALPIFSVDDEDLFHEINHAICSEFVMKNGESIIKCGLNYSNDEKKYITEIINDITSLEIYNIFKSKCSNVIYDDNIMSDVFTDPYKNYQNLIKEFYELNKDRIKALIIDDSAFQIKKDELKTLSKLIQYQINKI